MKPQASTQTRIRHERLSDAQIEVLLAGLDQKLSRSSMGWSVNKYTPRGEVRRIFSPATIKSLAKKQLIDANFDDPRGFEKGSLAREVSPTALDMNIRPRSRNFLSGPTASVGRRWPISGFIRY